MKLFSMISVLVVGAAAAQAQVLAVENFDTLSIGAIGGQSSSGANWSAFSDPFLVSNNRSFSGPNSALKAHGSQTFTNEWAWPDIVPEYDSLTTSNKIVKASVMIYFETGAGLGSFGLDAFQSNPTFGRVAAVRINQDGSMSLSGQTATTTTAAGLATLNRWNKVELTMNFATGTASASLNGSNIGLTGSFTRTALADVDLFSSRAVGATHLGWFDDYRVEAVPEPASMTALGLGVLALLRRRTKKAA